MELLCTSRKIGSKLRKIRRLRFVIIKIADAGAYWQLKTPKLVFFKEVKGTH